MKATKQAGLGTCQHCGATLDNEAAGAVCLRCALGNALESVPDSGTVRLATVASSTQTMVGAAPTPTRFGDYELLEEIARGGMGIVYKARQVSLDRLVAVKMILLGPSASPEQVRRFRTEASAAGCLQHPNIVAVHEVGLQGNQHYLVMDYVDGPNLGRLVQDRPLPAREAARYVRIIAEAVHYAHERGILHRDLKPSNVLVDSEDRPRVVDFGLAKRLDGESSLTLSSHVLGSPGYMPPEQAGAGRVKVGRHSDIYSLGAILYHLVTGRPPFQAETVAQALFLVTNTEPLSPRLLNPGLPRDLETICLKCLEKDPAKRYPTAQALADELGRFGRQEPIQARPITRPERVWRWCYRKPVLALLLALLHIVGAVGLAGILWQWRRAEHIAISEKNQRAAAQQKQAEAESERLRAQAEQQRADTQARKASESQQQARRLLYASDMNLAQQALRLNNLGKARRLLDRHRPQPGEEDLRGWEWRYLWQLTRSSALVTLTNGGSAGFSLSFSPDGRRLAVGWFNGRVDLWDVPNRRQLQTLTDRHELYQGRVAFSPVGNLLAATDEPRNVKLYDLDSGRQSILWRAPDREAWIVRDLSFSRDGSKAVIYAGFPSNPSGTSDESLSDEVWVVNVSSSAVESRHPAGYSSTFHFGAAGLSPDNRRLYLGRGDSSNYRYSIQCVDLTTTQQVWQTEMQRDLGLTTLAVSPDGRVLATGSGFEDPAIRIWDAESGRLLFQLAGHTGFVSHLAFSKDGRQLISAAADQTVRIWNTSTWREARVLRGHADEIFAVAVSESAQLVASASKDGNLVLWKEDGTSTLDGYTQLPDKLQASEVLPLNNSGLLLLPTGKPAAWLDLKCASAPTGLPGIGAAADVLGFFGTNILCTWDGTNQILAGELLDGKWMPRQTLALDSRTRPTGFTYYPGSQLVAWTEGSSSLAVFLTHLTAPGHRIELRSDAPGLIPFRFSEDGKYLAAAAKRPDALHAWDNLRVWSVESGQLVASVDGVIRDAIFAAGGKVLVVALTVAQAGKHEIQFYDLSQPDRPIKRVAGAGESFSLASSPDGTLVASSSSTGQVRLFNPAQAELIDSLYGHLNGVFAIAFSPDGKRLISASGGREAVMLWDLGTRQELLTLPGAGSLFLATTWSTDGDVILAGAPWQAWRAPSWAEITAAEAKQKSEAQ